MTVDQIQARELATITNVIQPDTSNTAIKMLKQTNMPRVQRLCSKREILLVKGAEFKKKTEQMQLPGCLF